MQVPGHLTQEPWLVNVPQQAGICPAVRLPTWEATEAPAGQTAADNFATLSGIFIFISLESSSKD